MTTSLTEQTAILAKYLELSQNGKILAEYVWIDAEGNTRSKCRTLSKNQLVLMICLNGIMMVHLLVKLQVMILMCI